jgi:hypothetical protein
MMYRFWSITPHVNIPLTELIIQTILPRNIVVDKTVLPLCSPANMSVLPRYSSPDITIPPRNVLVDMLCMCASSVALRKRCVCITRIVMSPKYKVKLFLAMNAFDVHAEKKNTSSLLKYTIDL